MLEWLKAIDTNILLFINTHNSAWADSFMWFVSKKFVWIPLYALLLFLFYKNYKKHLLKILIAIILLITISDNISSRLLKKNVKRYRPTHHIELQDKLHLHQYEDGSVYRGGKYGFASSHASNTMAIAVFALLLLPKSHRKWTSLLIIWSLIICYSRIYLGVHYPSDIFAGLIIGALAAGFIYYLLRKISPKMFTKEEAK